MGVTTRINLPERKLSASYYYEYRAPRTLLAGMPSGRIVRRGNSRVDESRIGVLGGLCAAEDALAPTLVQTNCSAKSISKETSYHLSERASHLGH
jgi:hypothetical protein